MLTKVYSISNAAYIFDGGLQKGSISIRGGFIGGFDRAEKYDLRLDKSLVVPAFINTYDSLINCYYPKIGHGKYSRWQEWYYDIGQSEVHKEKSKLDKSIVYLLGAYRNFISGVLTVLDYSPYMMEGVLESLSTVNEMPVRILNNYIGDMSAQDGTMSKTDSLFVVDIYEKCTNYDERALDILIESGSLGGNSILMHGVSLSDSHIENISKAKAGLVWCPSSDYFLFDKLTDIKKYLDGGVNVSLASAMAISGSNTFLDEISFAKNCYKKMYGKELHEKILYNMITVNAAKCLKLSTLGVIKQNATADLLILKDNGEPYKTVYNLELSDIEAIIQNGKFVYANEKYSEMVYKCSEKVYSFNVLGEKRYCCYDIKGLIEKIRSVLGYIKELPFLPID